MPSGIFITHLENVRTAQEATYGIRSTDACQRDAFLHVYDDPEPALNNPYTSTQKTAETFDWYQEVKARTSTLKFLGRGWHPDKQKYTNEDQQRHLDTILSMIDTARTQPSPSGTAAGVPHRQDDRSSRNIESLTSIIQESPNGLERLIFDIASRDLSKEPSRMTRSVSNSLLDNQRSAAARRLHTLLGPAHQDRHVRKHAGRKYVYDWSLTTEANDYGPFLKDGSGRVDWTLLEAAMTCIANNFDISVEGRLSAPVGLHYSIPYRTVIDSTKPEDWAGVTGKWLGTYAFLDYASLLAWNSGLMGHDVGFPTLTDLSNEPEACGDLLMMDLKLDDSLRTDPVLRSNVPFSDKLPPLYFKGTSRGSEYPNHPVTTIKGFCALVVGGREVKWKFVVEYHGVDQWQLEGVQPGGIRSGGIFGLWSNVEHEPNGPVGPFCYYPHSLCKSTSVVLMSNQDELE
ncbi:uncharacterized protein AB675_4928 [Cyphellophora attinorum]|uniref:Uncharacterized protein n=1 Tax=Cyphellophora attinorum TaxID=1664694 RepID=A0A0N1HGM3_9EURO|nr:uncharacterized protein AB675_4928 [Phialophora attinorum]KPI34614.1 hypothetical protein AB675_4928 [Phialophora attinorum]